MTEETEKAHVRRVQQGDLKSFRWVYDRYHARVYSFCRKLINDSPAAEEITSDVFVRLWEKRGTLDSSFPIHNLLFKITRDLVWNHLKKESRQTNHYLRYSQERQLVDPTPAVEAELIFQDYLNIAEAAIKQLPDKRRKVFNLHYKRSLDNGEIARQLDISESTVRVHLYKATQFLRTYLKSHPEILILVLTYLWW